MLLLFNSILTLLGIPIPIPIIIVAACEFEEDKVDSMEVQQALPPVPEVSEPLPLAQEPVPPLFEIQASEVNQEDIWRELEQQEQPAPTTIFGSVSESFPYISYKILGEVSPSFVGLKVPPTLYYYY